MITKCTHIGGFVPVSPFGVYLRQKRAASGKSLREVAEALSITHVYLGEVERGRRRVLPVKYWKRLVRTIPEMSVDELRLAAETSEPIDPATMVGRERDVVVALARTLKEEGMSEALAKKLLQLLRKKRS